MEKWMERVFDESNELEKRLLKLRYFMESSEFPILTEEEKSLIQRQFTAMKDYSNILKARISLF